MQSIASTRAALHVGAFVRVRADHDDSTRAGRDATVVEIGESVVGLIFGLDRHGCDQGAHCVGVEAWDEGELDLATVEH